jgi:hypothetical protein
MTNHFLPQENENQPYYDRMQKKRSKDFAYTIKALAVLLALFILGMIITGCASASIPPATSSVGTVLQVDGDRVLVTFPVVTEKLGSQSANWFYIPGHRYEVRDRYPDPSKDPSL